MSDKTTIEDKPYYSFEEVLDEQLQDPSFAANGIGCGSPTQFSLQMIRFRAKHKLSQTALANNW